MLFFEERVKSLVEESALHEDGVAPDSTTLEAYKRAASGALHKLYKALQFSGEPTPYYAYLLADGDRMGVALDHITNADGHRRLSTALEAFAKGCADVVARHAGSLVYSGGDDVLALLPLHTALDCARALRDAFNRHVHPAVAGLGLKDLPTLSVGLGVAHHMDSMTHARSLAKRAETLAKESGRNALAVVVDKRSGGTLEAVHKWTDDNTSLDRSIESWARLLESEALPDRAAFELEALPRVFDKIGPGEPAETPSNRTARNEALVALAKRVLGRRRSQRGASELEDAAVDALEERLDRIERDKGGDARRTIATLAHEIQIARLFLGAWRDAWMPKLGVGQ